MLLEKKIQDLCFTDLTNIFQVQGMTYMSKFYRNLWLSQCGTFGAYED